MESVIRRLRLGSGLVMLAYVTTHLLNHSLGLLSVDTMDRVLKHIYDYWASPLGSVFLYGAFATHYSLALWALWLRSSLRMPVTEATQLTLDGAVDGTYQLPPTTIIKLGAPPKQQTAANNEVIVRI